jgi:transcriptional regulator with XRE-family HTH domain
MTQEELGAIVKAVRERAGLTQDQLAQSLSPPTNRTAVALFEQGKRFPGPAVLAAICTRLGLPQELWAQLAEPEAATRFEFESTLSELVGHPVSLQGHDLHAVATANHLVSSLFEAGLTEEQALDHFNALLVFYGVEKCSAEFFGHYLGADAFRALATFAEAVVEYQKDAIRLFSTFSDAFRVLNDGELHRHLEPLQPLPDAKYRARSDWTGIQRIEDAQLPMLGYISASEREKAAREREYVAEFLRNLAGKVKVDGVKALDSIGEKTKRKVDSLLRKLESNLKHGLFSPLFAPDSDALLREAEVLGPKGTNDLETARATERTAETNLARYLASDHLDVYVATSMRTDADFVSVNRFVSALFEHPEVRPLKLRYFNPTQSWIDDRVAKGLVEALMLRRSSFTIYMAQKTDSFGKDSEASVALGQGKPVVVYVPRLTIPALEIDTDILGAKSREELHTLLVRQGDEEYSELDQTIDQEALLGQLLKLRLAAADNTTIVDAVIQHWADFDLYGEDERIKSNEVRAQYRSWLDKLTKGGQRVDPPADVRKEVEGILISRSIRFEQRARMFRAMHPLALQVIHSTGVLNGILVVRSIESCAQVVRGIVLNDLEFDLVADDPNNYKLIERGTRSIIRVISRHPLIRNAFSRYFERIRQDREQ